MITVLTWFWRQEFSRAKYGPEDVNIWASGVRRNLSMPHRVACVTRDREGIDPSIEIIEPPGDFEHFSDKQWSAENGLPQCYRRVAMFAPWAAEVFGQRFLCTDLDVVFTGRLDPVVDRPDEIVFAQGSPRRPYNGSMMLMTAGCRPQVYNEFTPERAVEASQAYIGSDQAWVSHCLGWGESTWTEADGVYFCDRNKLKRMRQLPKGARVVFFPGSLKHWDCVDGLRWVKEHWR